MSEEKQMPSVDDTTRNTSLGSDGHQVASSPESQAPVQVSEFNARSITALIAAHFALFLTAGVVNAYGVFQTYYSVNYLSDLSNFQISWIGSVSTFFFFAIGPVAGILTDKFGPTTLLTVGAVIEVFATMMVSLCKKYYQFFLAQGILTGVAFGLISISAVSVIPLYFQRNRGLAQGITAGGSSLGGVIWPIIVDQLLYRDGVSFGWTLRIVGFIMIPLCVVVVVGLRRPLNYQPPPAQKKEQVPAEVTPAEVTAVAPPKPPHKLAALKSPAYIFLAGGLAIFYFGFFTPFFFIPEYALHIGQSQQFAFYMISVLNAASLFGRIVPGIIADRVGHFNILFTSALLSGIVCFCWTTVHNVAGLIFFALAYGFVSGAVLSLQFACASLIAPRESAGAAIGILMGSIALTVLFGSPIAGELLERGWIAVTTFSGGIMLLGSVLIACARLSRNRSLIAKV